MAGSWVGSWAVAGSWLGSWAVMGRHGQNTGTASQQICSGAPVARDLGCTLALVGRDPPGHNSALARSAPAVNGDSARYGAVIRRTRAGEARRVAELLAMTDVAGSRGRGRLAAAAAHDRHAEQLPGCGLGRSDRAPGRQRPASRRVPRRLLGRAAVSCRRLRASRRRCWRAARAPSSATARPRSSGACARPRRRRSRSRVAGRYCRHARHGLVSIGSRRSTAESCATARGCG